MRSPRPLPTTLVAVLAALVTLLVPGPAHAAPPGIPDAATARTQLAALTVAPEAGMSGYSRDKFPHWITRGGCTTRQTVLKRDGSDVTTGANCRVESGTWVSPYDGATLTSPSKVDIDHIVPLAESWRSGAAEWTTPRRQDFANDLDHPQLLAASASSNRSKGDQDPADWQPTADFHCAYARMWVSVKHTWELAVDEDEKAALDEMLGTC
ncbi:HNH endonuclease family protein [Streptomyces avicenniae]|uniref:HNH endonuclease family protein n=1 Tax=Streptomyces avicenniae TaxID=500153 RepID=UPI00069C5FDE|nr:HNH endonuclease family protein [Streptomyces avicenniae]